MARKDFQLGLEMPALLGGIATLKRFLTFLKEIGFKPLEMPALLGGIATTLLHNTL